MKRFLCALILAGCVTTDDLADPLRWSKPGVTRQQTTQDLAACRVMASATSGEALGRGLIFIEAEKHRRAELVRDAMIAKGYSPVP